MVAAEALFSTTENDVLLEDELLKKYGCELLGGVTPVDSLPEEEPPPPPPQEPRNRIDETLAKSHLPLAIIRFLKTKK